MDITLVGRNVGITDRFRDYATEKSGRIEHLAEKAIALEIRLCRHHETHGTAGDDRVELTLVGPGPVVRAEASGSDKFVAFDVALDKLVEQVRRAKDRKKPHRGHGNRMTPLRVAASSSFADAAVVPADGDAMRWAETGPQQLATEDGAPEAESDEEPYNPVVIRRKQFEAAPMTVDDALYRMELVGHDFFLFVDSVTGNASVVYRRKGWDYGLLTVETAPATATDEREPALSTT